MALLHFLGSILLLLVYFGIFTIFMLGVLTIVALVSRRLPGHW